jgi:succinate dehydrogenase / fumarate reductase, flavoprotein subunit
MLTYDVVVVGGGVAGLRAALAASEGTRSLALISRVHPPRSPVVAAQSGVNAVLGRESADTPEEHALDTVRAGEHLSDQRVAWHWAEEARRRVIELEHWGCAFDRDEQGRLAQQHLGGQRYPRTAYCLDRTGRHVLQTLYQQAVRRSLRIFDECVVTALVTSDRQVEGLIALDLTTGEYKAVQARTVIFAQGGPGSTFGRARGSLGEAAQGLALAWRAGARLRNLEFVEFHPLTLPGKNLPVAESCLLWGALLLRADGVSVLGRNPLELSRHELARAVFQAAASDAPEGNTTVQLDLRPLGAAGLQRHFPHLSDYCRDFLGVDPSRQALPVEPAPFFLLGGIETDLQGATGIAGFFAAGEVSCSGFHGAGSLAGNLLLESLISGNAAGVAATRHWQNTEARPGGLQRMREALHAEEERLELLFHRPGRENPHAVRRELAGLFHGPLGLVRSKDGLAGAQTKIESLAERLRQIRPAVQTARFNLDRAAIVETEAELELTALLARCALERTESRGCHVRIDYPKHDDARWLAETLLEPLKKGPKITHRPVEATRFPVEERTTRDG